ncbi:hypothetical protein [Paenibacillus alvei]|uniref:hypothetical protein n=1 Tax=Paenibacillus alvei TaxID=44250 RepID=UPI000385FECA|nr:hypothetical protein [Paenibacillus alvei]EPY13692.1 hypothetical protein PAAL66ix_06668 [Paenibacillus alvei A6-6i-x]
MPSPYFLRYKNTIIGIFIETIEGLRYYPSHDSADKLPNGLGYPLGLFPLDAKEYGLIPNKNHTPTSEDITLWLSDRVFPKDRQGVEALLKEIGLAEYDMWEITKVTKGISLSDYYWLSSNPNDHYQDVHPRFVVTHSHKITSNNYYVYKPENVINSYSELKNSLNNGWENLSSLSAMDWNDKKIQINQTNYNKKMKQLTEDYMKMDLNELKKMKDKLNNCEQKKFFDILYSFKKRLSQSSLISEKSEVENKEFKESEKVKKEKDTNKNIDEVWD